MIPCNYVIRTHHNSSASISSACLALRILLLRISNLGSARTLARYGDAPGNSKRRDRSVCCLTSLAWLSILTNLEYKSLFTFTSNKIKRKQMPWQMHTAYVRHVHQYFYQPEHSGWLAPEQENMRKQSNNTASGSESTERTPNTRQLL